MADSRASDHYAKEAQRLLSDDTLKFALDKVRTAALEELARADGKKQIMRLQQKVAVIDEFREELRAATLNLANPANSTGTFA